MIEGSIYRKIGEIMTRKASGLAVALVGLSLTGCSSIISGTSQEIQVTTEPQGALCEVYRDGASLGAVNPTPGTVKVGKSRRDIAFECKKAGYQDQTAYAGASFDPVTLGNILLGGIIGLGVDFGTGAYTQYPDAVFVQLEPAQFGAAPAATEMAAPQSADAAAAARDKVNQDADAAVAKIRAQCTGSQNNSRACAAAIEVINAERARLLAAIDAR